MSILEHKITPEQLDQYGVVASPDMLLGTAQENKAVFDRLVKTVVCGAVNAAIDELSVLETTNIEWSDAEAGRVAAELVRVTAEAARETAEHGRDLFEQQRRRDEAGRQNAEGDRVGQERNRVGAENARLSAETARQTAEAGRTSAEQGRMNAEGARTAEEKKRADAEGVRQAQEGARQTEESGRSEAEAGRVLAEQGRVTAETGRVNAEGLRATAETSRDSAEQSREAAEDTRKTAETGRGTAEQGRKAAETARASAEDARNVWGDYDATTVYKPGNKVVFNGSSYLCTAACTGVVPTDTACWRLIAAKGDKGDTGERGPQGVKGDTGERGPEGPAGPGSGDMLASVYDPTGKAQDVFAYADKAVPSDIVRIREGASESAAAMPDLSVRYTAEIGTSWTDDPGGGWVQTVAVAGLPEWPFKVRPTYGSMTREIEKRVRRDFANVCRVGIEPGQITVWCWYQKPDGAIPIEITM